MRVGKHSCTVFLAPQRGPKGLLGRGLSHTVNVEIPLLPSSLCSWIEWGTDVLFVKTGR